MFLFLWRDEFNATSFLTTECIEGHKERHDLNFLCVLRVKSLCSLWLISRSAIF